MHHHKPDWGEQVRKAQEAEIRLVRHEKRTRLALALLFVVNGILLAMVVSQLWGHPWMQESIQEIVP